MASNSEASVERYECPGSPARSEGYSCEGIGGEKEARCRHACVHVRSHHRCNAQRGERHSCLTGPPFFHGRFH